jgi:hypothetical protein
MSAALVFVLVFAACTTVTAFYSHQDPLGPPFPEEDPL